jgi:hypothetical protein
MGVKHKTAVQHKVSTRHEWFSVQPLKVMPADDEADPRIKLAFDLGDDAAELVPASGPDSRSWRSIVELRLMSPDRALEQEAGGALGGSLSSSRKASSPI